MREASISELLHLLEVELPAEFRHKPTPTHAIRRCCIGTELSSSGTDKRLAEVSPVVHEVWVVQEKKGQLDFEFVIGGEDGDKVVPKEFAIHDGH